VVLLILEELEVLELLVREERRDQVSLMLSLAEL